MIFDQELTRLKQAEGEMKIGMTRLRKESVTTSDAMSKLQVNAAALIGELDSHCTCFFSLVSLTLG